MAALKFSMDMVKEKLIDWRTPFCANPADQLDQLLARCSTLNEVKKAKVIATGLPAGPGAAPVGFISTPIAPCPPRERVKSSAVRVETSPEDLRG